MSDIKYQKDSAEKIYKQLFGEVHENKNENQNQRYLLADEVGLGKTITAANVIIKLLENTQNDQVKIGYICSNLALAQINVKKLEKVVKDNFKDVEIVEKKTDRLSLGILKYTTNTSDKKVKLIIETITPSTSIKVLSPGTKLERSIAYSLIQKDKPPTDIWKEAIIGKANTGIENSDDIKFSEDCKELFDDVFKEEYDSTKERIKEATLKEMRKKFSDFNKRNEIVALLISEKLVKDKIDIGNKINTIEKKLKEKLKDEDRKQCDKSANKQYQKHSKKIKEDIDHINKSEKSNGKIFEKVQDIIRGYLDKEFINRCLISCLDEIHNEVKGDGRTSEFVELLIKDCYSKICKKGDEFEEKYNHCEENKLCNRCEECYKEQRGYKLDIKDPYDKNILQSIKDVLSEKYCKEVLKIARKAMSITSLRMMEVDLFIADEIQNYSEIITRGQKNPEDKNKAEVDLVAHEILYKNENKILLMSATPFRYRSKLEEFYNDSADKNADSQIPKEEDEEVSNQDNFLKNQSDVYKEFKMVVEYLNKEFDFTLWENLCKVKAEAIENKEIEKAKNTVLEQTDMLKKAKISRVERYMANVNNVIYKDDTTVDLTLEDMLEVPILEQFKEVKKNATRMDYIKSTPAFMSFNQGYDEFIYTNDASGNAMVSKEEVENFSELTIKNRRLKKLFHKVFEVDGLHKLLFIPPVNGKGKLLGVFAGKKGVSKRLFFTDYNMTSKSLSSLLTYEANRRVCEDFSRVCEDLKKINEGIPVTDEEIYLDIEGLKSYNVKKYKLHSKKYKVLDELYEVLFKYDEKLYNDMETCENYKNSSPYYYAFEKNKDKFDTDVQNQNVFKDNVREFCYAYYKLMTTVESLRVILAYSKEESLYKSISKYAYEGSIYDVFDEYIYTNDTFLNDLKTVSDTKFSDIQAYAKEPNCMSFKMKTGFAIGHYAGDTLSDGSKAGALARKILAFNSPFRPFNFITTSIGQEGFDFHKYCRKIVHWSLVYDPVKFEQREGRIDRYHSYANRLNVYEQNVDLQPFTDWENLYKCAKANNQDKVESSMGLYPDFIVEHDRFKIERETYYYKHSFEHKMINEVLNRVGFYRSLLGQAGEDTFEDDMKEFIESIKSNEDNKYKSSDFFIDLRPKPNDDGFKD